MPQTLLIIQVGECLTSLLVKPPNLVNTKFRPKLWTRTTQTSNTSKDADSTATVLSPQQPATSRALCHGSSREGAQAGATTPPLLFHGMPALTYKQCSIKPPQKVQYLPVCSSWCYSCSSSSCNFLPSVLTTTGSHSFHVRSSLGAAQVPPAAASHPATGTANATTS